MPNIEKPSNKNPSKASELIKAVIPNAFWDFLKEPSKFLNNLGIITLVYNLFTILWVWVGSISAPIQVLLIYIGVLTLVAIGSLIISRHLNRQIAASKDELSISPDIETKKTAAEYEQQLAEQEEFYRGDAEYQKSIYETTLKQKQELFEKQLSGEREKHQIEIENIESLHAEEIKKLDVSKKILYRENLEMEKHLANYKFLIEKAEKQRAAINEFIELDKFFFNRIKEKALPHIVFTFQLKNNSFFDVTLENSIEGIIEFNGQPLQGEKRFFDRPKLLSPNKYAWYNFEYRVSREEYEFITKFTDPEDQYFDISKLLLTIIGANQYSEIASQKLVINHRSRVYDYGEYQKATEKFSF